MDLGIFAKTFNRTSLNGVLDAVKENHFSCLQFNMACAGLPSMPEYIPENLPQQIYKALKERDLSMSALSGTFNMTHPDKRQREKDFASLAILIQHSKMMGTDVITLCTGSFDAENMWRFHPENNSKNAWNILCETMEKVLKLAESSDVILGIEPELANVINSAEKAKQLLQDMQSKHLKIVFDPANLFEKASQKKIEKLIGNGISLLADDIILAHAKDRNPDGSFTAAGMGVLPYPFFLKELNSAGFNGNLITHGLPENEAQFCYRFLEEQLSKL